MSSLFDTDKAKRNTMFIFDEGSNNESEFIVDVTTSFVTNLQGTLTDFPVEFGSSISDHFQKSPMTVSMQGFISESPSNLVLSLATQALAGVVGNQFQGLSSTFASAAVSAGGAQFINGNPADPKWRGGDYKKLLMERDKDARDFPKRAMLGLFKMFENGTIFTIRSFFDTRIYSNMIITNLSFPFGVKTGESLQFSLTAKKIVTVAQFSSSVREFKAKDPINAGVTKNKPKGKVKPKTVPASTLAQGVDGLLDFFN